MGSIGSTILNIDRRIIWAICIILLAWPLISPIGLPIRVDKITQQYYDGIEALPPGSIIATSLDIEAGLTGELEAQIVDTLQHLFDNEIKFIQVTFYRADAAVLFETVFLPQVNQRDSEYGVDWVNIGYIEGHETAMSAFASDFTYSVKDYYGNLLEDLPLIKEASSMDDVVLYIDVGSGDTDQALRQFSTPYDLITLRGTMAMGVPESIMYMDSGIVHGILGGLPGAAQYELLRNKPGAAIRGMDALSAVHVFLIGLIIITNVAYIAERSRKGMTQ